MSDELRVEKSAEGMESLELKVKEVAEGEGDNNGGKEEESVPGVTKEGADSTTTPEGDKDKVKGDGQEGEGKGKGAEEDENKVTSSGNGERHHQQRGRKRSGGGGGGERIVVKKVYRDARDRIEDRRRQQQQQQQQQRNPQHTHRNYRSHHSSSLVDYVSRSDRAHAGRGLSHCVDCNLAFVSGRSERLHRDSQRHVAVLRDRKRPLTLTGRVTPYACYLCWRTYDSSGQLFRHYGSDEHVQRMRK